MSDVGIQCCMLRDKRWMGGGLHAYMLLSITKELHERVYTYISDVSRGSRLIGPMGYRVGDRCAGWCRERVHDVLPLMPYMTRRRNRIVPIRHMGFRLLRGICTRLRHGLWKSCRRRRVSIGGNGRLSRTNDCLYSKTSDTGSLVRYS